MESSQEVLSLVNKGDKVLITDMSNMSKEEQEIVFRLNRKLTVEDVSVVNLDDKIEYSVYCKEIWGLLFTSNEYELVK
jgi:Na+-transporting NADH:ubiquinone oxidoreductase subunit NqrF